MARLSLPFFVILAWIFGTPCSSRSILPLRDSAGGPPFRKGNPSMVVRIIVSSSSSSSSEQVPLLPAESIQHPQIKEIEEKSQNLSSSWNKLRRGDGVASRRIDHGSPSNSQESSRSFVFFSKQSSITLPPVLSTFSVTSSTTPVPPTTAIQSVPSLGSVSSTPRPSSFYPKVPFFKPTTFRPRPKFSFKPRPLFWLASTTPVTPGTTSTTASTTTASTTIRPVPFREDIFSVFYRAFTQPTELSPIVQPNSQVVEGEQVETQEVPVIPSRNAERFISLPRQRKVEDMRKIPYTGRKNATEAFGKVPAEGKIVTAIVSTSSTSSVSSGESSRRNADALSPRINANYPRVRPSSVMLMNMRSGSDQDPSPGEETSAGVVEEKIGLQHDLESENTQIGPEQAFGDRTQDDLRARGTDGVGPRAEALIQEDSRALSSEKLDVKIKPEAVPEEQKPVVWQVPEQVWSEPAKVWGEPAKVWGEPAKVWGEPAKVWSVPPTLPSPVESTTIQSKAEVTNDTYEEEEEAPRGSFYVLGEDEDEENPSETIPPEFSQKVGIPAQKLLPSVPVSSDKGGNYGNLNQLPDKTPQVDHSFVDAPVASVHVAESIQLALQRQVNIRVHPTSYTGSTTGYFSRPSSNSNTQSFITSKPRFQIQSSSESQLRVGSSDDPAEDTDDGRENDATGGKKFGYVLDGNDLRKYRVEERTPDGFIVGEYGILNQNNGFLRGVRYTADGTINPRLIHEALMKFLSL